jgi:hypothetical protein
MLALAQQYAAGGSPIVPCQPGGKALLEGYNLADATKDLKRIREIWSAHPDANIGFCPASLDRIVIDADLQHPDFAHDVFDRLLKEASRVHQAPHSNHLYFETKVQHSGIVELSPGLTAYSAGEHVLLPGSVVDGKAYEVTQACGRVTEFPPWADELRRAAGSGQVGPRAPWELLSPASPSLAVTAPAERNLSRFGGWTATEGVALPPITYWDQEQLLPQHPNGGITGYLIGETGSHKSGIAIMLALNAIRERGARVLYLATEGALGVAKYRLPKACRVAGIDLKQTDRHWRLEPEEVDICDEQDREDLFQAYRDFAPNLVFVDVMTLAVGGMDINTTKDAIAVRRASQALSRGFGGATVLFVHHPSRKGMSADGSGSNMFKNLADFQLHAFYDKGVVKVFVKKMKDGQPDRWVFFRNGSFDTKNPLDDGVPVIRRMTEEELREFKGRKEPRPNVEKENATDAEAVAQLSSDVRRFLHMIDRPTLIRDFANLMIRSDESYLDQTMRRLSEKDHETLTEDEIRERCRDNLIKRLTRGIGTDKDPGELYPFMQKVASGKERGKLPPRDRRFSPLGTRTHPHP